MNRHFPGPPPGLWQPLICSPSLPVPGVSHQGDCAPARSFCDVPARVGLCFPGASYCSTHQHSVPLVLSDFAWLSTTSLFGQSTGLLIQVSADHILGAAFFFSHCEYSWCQGRHGCWLLLSCRSRAPLGRRFPQWLHSSSHPWAL